jgi:hypothetical protein
MDRLLRQRRHDVDRIFTSYLEVILAAVDKVPNKDITDQMHIAETVVRHPIPANMNIA